MTEENADDGRRTVLVPVDDSPLADDAVAYAATHYPDADIVAFHVVDVVESVHAAPGDPGLAAPSYWEAIHEDAHQRSETVLENAREVAAEHGVEIRVDSAEGRAARRIVGYAEEQGVDEIVIASHGRTGVSRILLGSVAEEVTRRAPCPVTVVR